jgi:Na+/H+-translocating membrane pyrophosphatase
MKIKKIDAILITVLFILIVLEFLVKSEELSHYQVIIGIVIGFSLGFKLSAVHGSTVSREAIEMVKKKDSELDGVSGEKIKNERAMKLELKRKEKLIYTLNQNLIDRDKEIKELIEVNEKLRERG